MPLDRFSIKRSRSVFWRRKWFGHAQRAEPFVNEEETEDPIPSDSLDGETGSARPQTAFSLCRGDAPVCRRPSRTLVRVPLTLLLPSNLLTSFNL